jgi:hypothetical protein
MRTITISDAPSSSLTRRSTLGRGRLLQRTPLALTRLANCRVNHKRPHLTDQPI